MTLEVVPSRPEDLLAIQAIYGHWVQNSTATWEEVPPDVAEQGRRRNEILAQGLPHLVLRGSEGVLGYAYARAFRPRSGWRHTVEDTVYVHPRVLGQGMGRILLHALLDRLRSLPVRLVVAVVSSPGSEASIRLHQALGFQQAGLLSQAGYKQGAWLDAVMLTLELDGGPTASL